MDNANPAALSNGLGVVVIGRNEGERLRQCLQSVIGRARQVVYVDSGSTDDSVAVAESIGAVVCMLDMRQPFTAARARNEGFHRLEALDPEAQFVQFVDGDCQVSPGWLDAAVAFLVARPEVAAVCGRRRERFPERSIYNMMCDQEWDTPVGPAKACGGDVAMRSSALREVGGYRDDLIAGEEPELCIRLRARGWSIWRLDAEMSVHDAAMTQFRQWWKRSMRTGFAYGQGAHLHGAAPEHHWVRESHSALLWGLFLPAGFLAMTLFFGRWALLGFSVYPLQVFRLHSRTSRGVRSPLAHSVFLVLGKFAEVAGLIKFVMHRLVGTSGRLIEYK